MYCSLWPIGTVMLMVQVIVLHGDIYVVVVPPTGSYFLVCSRPSFSTVKCYLLVVTCLVVGVLLTEAYWYVVLASTKVTPVGSMKYSSSWCA